MQDSLTQNSHALHTRALNVFPSGVTHDNRDFGEVEPVYIERAQGSRKWDVEGNECIKLAMSRHPMTNWKITPL